VYKLYRRRTPFEYFGGDQATVNDCADATAILMSSGGPGARTVYNNMSSKQNIFVVFE